MKKALVQTINDVMDVDNNVYMLLGDLGFGGNGPID